MDTSVFLPKSEMRAHPNPSLPDREIVGIDLGYSSTKVAFSDGFACVPSFCRKMKGELVGQLGTNDLVYEADGVFYQVGQLALSALKNGEVVDEGAFYGREHYIRPEFLVQFRTAMGMVLWDKEAETPIKITSGLPPAYILEDREYFVRALSGRHNFTLHWGKKTKKFSFTINESDIDVIIQPMGTFYSIGMNQKGEITPMLRKYWNSSTLIFDGGFGTLDVYLLRSNEVERSTTDNSLGMKRVFEEVRNALYKDKGVSVTIPEIMSNLNTGKIQRVDKIKFTCEEIDFSNYMKAANNVVASEALNSISDAIGDTDVLVMTGGTGAAWHGIFGEKLKALVDIGKLQLITGNVMDQSLPNYLSNVRGYYLRRYYQESHK